MMFRGNLALNFLFITYQTCSFFASVCRNDRRMKEALSQVEEEKGNSQRLQDQVCAQLGKAIDRTSFPSSLRTI